MHEPFDHARPQAGPEPPPAAPAVRPTGDPGVDAGLRRLADAGRLPVSGHREVYEDVHRILREALTALDRQPEPPAPLPPPAAGS